MERLRIDNRVKDNASKVQGMDDFGREGEVWEEPRAKKKGVKPAEKRAENGEGRSDWGGASQVGKWGSGDAEKSGTRPSSLISYPSALAPVEI